MISKLQKKLFVKKVKLSLLTKSILDAAIEAKATDLETVKALVVNGTPVANLIVDEIGKTGEKMELGYYEAISAPYTTAYIHPGNKLATIVGFNLADTDYQVAHDVAMQAAAMSPIAVSRDEVPADVVEKELEKGNRKQFIVLHTYGSHFNYL